MSIKPKTQIQYYTLFQNFKNNLLPYKTNKAIKLYMGVKVLLTSKDNI